MPDSARDEDSDKDAASQPLFVRIFSILVDSVKSGFQAAVAKIHETKDSPEAFSRMLRYIVIGTLGFSLFLVLVLVLFYRPAAAASTVPNPKALTAPVSGTSGNSTLRATASSDSTAPGSPGGTILNWISTPIDPDSYLVPELRGFGTGVQWRLSRLPRDKWSEKDVSRFWIDPRMLVVEHLSKRNAETIDNLLASVP